MMAHTGKPVADSFSHRRTRCAVCDKDVAIISDGRPVRSHRRGRFHQAALAAKKRIARTATEPTS